MNTIGTTRTLLGKPICFSPIRVLFVFSRSQVVCMLECRLSYVKGLQKNTKLHFCELEVLNDTFKIVFREPPAL